MNAVIAHPAQAVAWIGLDVSKASFHAAAFAAQDARSHRDLAVREFPRTPAGAAGLLAWAKAQFPAGAALRAVMESTGSYSQELCSWLLEAEPALGPAVLNPHAALHFAKSLGERSKTDRADARVLARYGAERRPAPFEPPSGVRADMRALLRHRESLVAQRTAMKEQKSHGLVLDPDFVTRSRERLIEAIDAEIETVEAELREAAAKDAALSADIELLSTIYGVAFLTAATLLSELGDLRRFRSARQLACFAGLTPRVRQSGTSVNAPAHITRAGNARVRRILYTCAMVAIRGDNDLAGVYRRLTAAGKKRNVAVIAVARKLLVTARAVLKSGKAYEKHHPQVRRRAA